MIMMSEILKNVIIEVIFEYCILIIFRELGKAGRTEQEVILQVNVRAEVVFILMTLVCLVKNPHFNSTRFG